MAFPELCGNTLLDQTELMTVSVIALAFSVYVKKKKKSCKSVRQVDHLPFFPQKIKNPEVLEATPSVEAVDMGDLGSIPVLGPLPLSFSIFTVK